MIRQESVLRIIGDCIQEGGDYQSKAKFKVIGTVVLTDYNNVTYKVDDIDWNQNPDSTFSYENREESFASYYQRKYQLTIRDRRQPLLVVKPTVRSIRGGKSKPIILIPELCRATGLTDQMRNDHRAMQEIVRPARHEPQQYIERLRNLNSRLQNNDQARQIFRQNQMVLDKELVEVQGKQMKSELICLSETVQPENEDWSRDLQNHKMFRPVDIKNWFIVYPREVESLLDSFQQKFMHIAENLGIKVEKAQLMRTDDSLKPSYVKILQRTMRQDPSLIMVFVTSKNTDLYKAIKYTTLCPDNAKPVPVQVVVKKTLERNHETLMSIITKIAIQVDCKLGGIPWTVDLKLKGLMVVGFDVSHDPKTKKKSYGAMVASLNPSDHGGHFYSTVNQHENGEQLSSNFGMNIIKAVRKYYELNNTLPARILIYRDGVGDGNVRRFIFLSKFILYKIFLNRSNSSLKMSLKTSSRKFIICTIDRMLT